MSFEKLFDFLWESEVVFAIFCVTVAVIAVGRLIFLWVKKMGSEDQGCAQEARVVKKEIAENLPHYAITFEIQASKEEKILTVKEPDADALSVGDRGMLYYKGHAFLRFVKEK